MNRLLVILAIVFLMPTGLTAGAPSARPATRAASAPSTRPVATEDSSPRSRLLQLSRRAIEQIRQKKYDAAQETLVEALVLEPDNPTNIYNMACVKSLLGKSDDAMAYLERAANAGFTDFVHIDQDPDLAPLRQLPQYKRLMASKDRYQKKAADKSLDALRAQFGDQYLYEIDTDNKLLFVANTDQQTLTDVKKWLMAQAKSQREMLFTHKPDQYIAILLPSPGDYRKLIRQPGVEGIYIHERRLLIARRLGQVMTHEFTHAMHAGDLEPLAQDHPIWIVEGMASLFEAGQFDGENLIPRDNFRLGIIQGAARTKRLIPLDKLITWKQPQFVANANLGYGQASSVMLYLYEKGLLRKFYDSYKLAFDSDPTGKATLERVTGKTLAQFEKEWIEWMLKRTPPTTTTGPDGAFIGVRFSQETDGLRVDEVVRGGPGDQAGLKLADVIVGLNDFAVRDQQSLMPVLKEFKPGDTVSLKVRRGKEFFSLSLTLGRRDGKTPATKPAPPR